MQGGAAAWPSCPWLPLRAATPSPALPFHHHAHARTSTHTPRTRLYRTQLYRLQSEHERYLTEEVFRQPIIVYNYPKDIKVGGREGGGGGGGGRGRSGQQAGGGRLGMPAWRAGWARRPWYDGGGSGTRRP